MLEIKKKYNNGEECQWLNSLIYVYIFFLKSPPKNNNKIFDEVIDNFYKINETETHRTKKFRELQTRLKNRTKANK